MIFSASSSAPIVTCKPAVWKAFDAKAEAERTGQLQTNEAKVESVDDGSCHLYFPVIKSAEVRRAIRAADLLLPTRKRKTIRTGRRAAA